VAGTRTSDGVRFDRICAVLGMPVPVPEYRFALAIGRKWQFDWAWVPQRVALEIEGGTWQIGRHQRRAGFIEDMNKYNTAILDGWVLIRVTPETLTAPETFTMIRRALAIGTGT
jgi:hypothetical protein